MLELLRRYMDAVSGLTEVSRERAEKIVAELQRRGEVAGGDIRRQAQQLAERSARNRRELVGLIQKEIRRQIGALGLATREDVAALEKRLDAVAPKRAKAAKPKSKASAARKPASASSARAKRPTAAAGRRSTRSSSSKAKR